MNWTDKLLNLFRHDSGPEIRGPISLVGDLHFPKGGKFDSRLKGKINSRLALLVGPEAEIIGDLRVENCQIQGQCEGRLDASGSVQIDATGRYSGKLVARSLRVEPDADFQSEVSVEPHPIFEEAPVEPFLVFADTQNSNASPTSTP